MLKRVLLVSSFLLVAFSAICSTPDAWIRVNQAGYLPGDVKVAVLISLEENIFDDFEVIEAVSGRAVFKGKVEMADGAVWGMKHACRLNFTSLRKEGGYYIVCGKTMSPLFKISALSYEGTADLLLFYMRQQRCGDNPYTGELCHQHDGFIVDHPEREGEKIDVTGGWHDATDYLQYLTTSATAVYQMMFAWQQSDRTVFKDRYDSRGREGANGLPDILDEIKWGLDWLLKMNPERGIMFNQIADDRDHAGFRLPQNDRVDYGWGPGTGRPVYFVTGKPQGLGKYTNRTTGVASTAGKFASSFRLGAELFKDTDTCLSKIMLQKAEDAYGFALSKPGNTQTACFSSPYFYEEDTYTDDIELAAATFYNYNGGEQWKKQADYWGELEPVTPWMELGRGRHYQYYPFINLGHFYLASSPDSVIARKYLEYMKDGLEHIRQRGASDPFMFGIPFLWCSNNLVSAALTQARLYRGITEDKTYLEMEMALRDWLFGCNPWGTSMIVGYPEGGDYPDSPHSSYTKCNGDLTTGGLIDGPIYYDLFRTRAGGALTKDDSYAVFNHGKAVYHDDIGDYSSNEPTMDGTAGLIFYLASLEGEGLDYLTEKGLKFEKDSFGAITRINTDKKVIYLVFTADSMFQGGERVLKTLSENKIKGSFFFTGNFLRMKEHKAIIKKLVKEGHYIGAHSDRHILYAPWDKRDFSLVSPDSLLVDLQRNYSELLKYGVKKDDAPWYLPPYEWYNKETVSAVTKAGLRLINYTPGSATPADYTTPDMKSYRASEELINKLFNFEVEKSLNGAIILIHPGVSELREDKLYDRLDEIVKKLAGLGYSFERLF
jgi:peptidoglycan/xylan/chitin deacetylase (PgdA/CDA1 family)